MFLASRLFTLLMCRSAAETERRPLLPVSDSATNVPPPAPPTPPETSEAAPHNVLSFLSPTKKVKVTHDTVAGCLILQSLSGHVLGFGHSGCRISQLAPRLQQMPSLTYVISRWHEWLCNANQKTLRECLLLCNGGSHHILSCCSGVPHRPTATRWCTPALHSHGRRTCLWTPAAAPRQIRARCEAADAVISTPSRTCKPGQCHAAQNLQETAWTCAIPASRPCFPTC